MSSKSLWLPGAAIATVATFVTIGAVPQQAVAQDDEVIEEIVVTGSYIRRTSQFDSPSPIQSVDAGDIEAMGAQNVADVIQTLTINTGSQNNPDAFTQNSTTGTSNFNLRGLGVASTLVLLNGHRQVLTALTTNDGVNFVDTSSLVPLIAVDNIEILKDGAAALYGTDAVAGVVNFLTRNDFDGLELSVDYLQQSDEGDYSEYTLEGIAGIQGDRGGLIMALSFLNRSPLTTAERRLSRTVDDTSALGNPGSFFGVPGFPPGAPVIDPTGCAEFGGIPQVIQATPPGVPDVGLCGFDFGDFFNLVPDETRLNGFARGQYDINDTLTFEAEIGFARNRVSRGNSPTFPILTFPTVPASNPGNVFGAPVQFFGRAIGNGGEVSNNRVEYDTWRTSIGVIGDIFDDWYWELNYTAGLNDSQIRTRDTLSQEFQDALNGFGGTNCTGPTDPTAVPGVGPCLYFNPFATSFTVLPNNPDVFDSFFAEQLLDGRSELQVGEFVVSGDIADMATGPVGFAFGLQFRKEELSQDYDSLSNQDKFAFVIGEDDFADDRDVNAAFAEFAIPLADTLDLQIAARFEDYGGAIGDTTDPKVALLYRPVDEFTVRGSFSQSFRAPSLFQTSGGATTLNQVNDPITGGTFFAAVRVSGTTDLQPEESDAWNVGGSWEPVDSLVFNLDYWRFDFTDVIIQENFQAVLNAFPQDPSRVLRAGDPLTGPVLAINTAFVNASQVETDGVDFEARYTIDTGVGIFQPFIEGTFILSYDLEDPQAGNVDGAGRRNFTNFGTSTPELRFNAGLGWLRNAWSANFFVRFIDSYEDDQNCADGTPSTGGACPGGVGFFEVDDHITLDLQASLDFGMLLGVDRAPTLTVGGINITGEEPPQVFTNGGFDSKVHDPRGRLLYARLTQRF